MAGLIGLWASAAWAQARAPISQCLAVHPEVAQRAAACNAHTGCRFVLNSRADCDQALAFLAKLPIAAGQPARLDNEIVFEAAQPALADNAELRRGVERARRAGAAAMTAAASPGRGLSFTSVSGGASYYEGALKDGHPEGPGILIADNGVLGRGEFRGALVNGPIETIEPDGAVSVREYNLNTPVGPGARQYADGTARSGDSEPGGKFVGRTLQTLADGSSRVVFFDAKGDFIAQGRLAPRGTAPKDVDVQTLKAIADTWNEARTAFIANRFADSEAAYRRLLPLQRSAYGDDDAETAQVYTLLGNTLLNEWKIAEAEPLLRRGLAIRTALLGETHADTAESYEYLAFLMRAAGRFDEAIGLREKSLAATRASLGEANYQTSLRYSFLALDQEAAGRFGPAELNFRKAVDAVTAAHAPSEQMLYQNSQLAGFYARRGRKADADTVYRRVLGIALSAPEASLQGPALAAHHADLAQALSSLGRLSEAEDYWRRAVAEAAGSQRRPTMTVNLAYVIALQRRPAEAEPLYRQAIGEMKQAGPLSGFEAAGANASYGHFLADQDRCREAVEQFNAALAIVSAERGKDAPDLITYLEPIAACQAKLGDLAGAEASQRRTLQIVANAGPTFYQRPVAFAELADTLAAQGRLAEAESTAQQAIAAARARARLIGSQPDTVDLSAETAPFARYLAIAWRAGEGDRRAADRLRADAFAAAQDISASAAARAMAQAAARTAAGNGPLAAAVRQEQDLGAHLRDLDADDLKATSRLDAETSARIRAEAQVVRAQLEAVSARIDREFPAYRQLVSPAALSLADAQALLRPDEGLLLFAVSGDDIYTFAVSRTASAWSRAADARAAIETGAGALRCDVDDASCSRAREAELAAQPLTPKQREGYERYDLTVAFSLYDRLVRPAEAALAGAKRVYIVAGGRLAEIPFAALVTAAPAPGADIADPAVLGAAPWFGDRYALTTLPAVSALRLRAAARSTSALPTPFRGYGDPVLGKPEPPAAPRAPGRGLAARGAVTVQVFRGLDASGGRLADVKVLATLPSLPGTRSELTAMARLFGEGPEGLRVGPEATERAIRADRQLASAGVVAIATHGLLPNNIVGMDEPGLVLTPPGTASADDDGILSASEAAGLNLSADWAILSACNTASGEGGGDSLSALSRGFLYAGAKALLASHWRVSDEATAVLTVETLRLRRQGGVTRAQALQQAMTAVRTGRHADGSTVAGWSEGWAHPAYWAAFTNIANQDE